MFLKLLVLAGVLVMAGCAAPSVAPALSPDHPASVDAAEAQYSPPQSVLVEDRAPPSPGATSQPTSTGADHQHHGATPPPATTRPHEATSIYACPMHPEVVSGSPAKCPKCGMNLVKNPNAGGLAPHEGGHNE